MYRIGKKTEPCGTPACISRNVGIASVAETLKFPSGRNELIALIMLAENCDWINLLNKPGCSVVLKAFLISKYTTAIDKLLLKFKVMWSVILIH
jgi:hypothetical protein